MVTVDSLFCPCLSPIQPQNMDQLLADSSTRQSGCSHSFFRLDPLRKYDLCDQNSLTQWQEHNGFRSEFQIGSDPHLGWLRIIDSPTQPHLLKLNLFFSSSEHTHSTWQILQEDLIGNNTLFKISVECLESDEILLNSLFSLHFRIEGALQEYHYKEGSYESLLLLARFYHD